jgi:hypothetical protein
MELTKEGFFTSFSLFLVCSVIWEFPSPIPSGMLEGTVFWVGVSPLPPLPINLEWMNWMIALNELNDS